jgi:hypothetical protein
MNRRTAPVVVVISLTAALAALAALAADPPPYPGHLEAPDDPPAAAKLDALATDAPATVVLGNFVSVQVNVDPSGMNRIGDAAACGAGANGAASFTAGPGNRFFLIVGNDATREGSYGTDGAGAGADRPEDAGTAGCDLPQALPAVTCE